MAQTTAAAAAAPDAAHLTPEQAAAAHAELDTPLMIIAAAGTGKTTTMLERVKFMVDQVGVRGAPCHASSAPRRCRALARGMLAPTNRPCRLAAHPSHRQGVPPEEVLVLTFSRRAASEFRQRLRARVLTADGVAVETFHAWSWAVVARHWREAGFERPPSIAAAEEQLLGVMRDCIV